MAEQLELRLVRLESERAHRNMGAVKEGGGHGLVDRWSTGHGHLTAGPMHRIRAPVLRGEPRAPVHVMCVCASCACNCPCVGVRLRFGFGGQLVHVMGEAEACSPSIGHQTLAVVGVVDDKAASKAINDEQAFATHAYAPSIMDFASSHARTDGGS